MSDAPNQPFDLSTDYFSVFSFPRAFQVDLKALKQSYLSLQQQCHPDRYANASEAAQRQAVQLTAYLNQARDTLYSPLKRAIYLLELAGQAFDTESETHTDADFLMAQLELREKLESIDEAEDPFAALDQLQSHAEQDYSEYQQAFVAAYTAEDWNATRQAIHKMMFASKFLEEIRHKEEILED